MSEIEAKSMRLIGSELGLPEAKVQAALELLASGNTIPFIARYRKEVTGSLDEVQLRSINERYDYLVELDKRREAILASIEEQGKLDDDLRSKIEGATTKAALEDLYLPYKPKRRTRATIAKSKGLEPLALRILAQPLDGDPRAEARAFIDAEKGVENEDAALAGARDIAAEVIAENAEIRAFVRERYALKGVLVSEVVPERPAEAEKYKDYHDYKEPVATIPSHRYLAVRRGEREGVLKSQIAVDHEPIAERICAQSGAVESSPFCAELKEAVRDGYKRLIAPSVETDLRADLKMKADRDAVDIFASNLRNLLLAAPYGSKSVVGVDPGLRTGCKCAALDDTGKFLGNMTFNLVKGDSAVEGAKESFFAFVRTHHPAAIAVGNGTHGRETEAFIRQCLRDADMSDIIVVSVNESGASVYSASELAGQEFPELDVTVRGAISIARRLQDPLAELVKIEPKSIGVGQYQHDVHQPLLVRKLDEVVESCVNHVGVELNTASAPLLSRVAGIGEKLALNIVQYRDQNGAFPDRQHLKKVAKLGPKAFEQAAGFLRIRGGRNPLDSSAVHPERYSLIERIAKDIGVDISELIGNCELAASIEVKRYASDEVGEPTLRDIIAELKKPGRDPRQTFEPPAFRDDVREIGDLAVGMELEGIVTNVTAFGAFVDIGVHQDGLVHISELADRFIKNPAEVVHAGDKIRVRVLDVDISRKRISLSARSEREQRKERPPSSPSSPKGESKPGKFSYNPFAELLRK